MNPAGLRWDGRAGAPSLLRFGNGGHVSFDGNPAAVPEALGKLLLVAHVRQTKNSADISRKRSWGLAILIDMVCASW